MDQLPVRRGTNYFGTDRNGGAWSGRSYELGGTTYFDATGPHDARRHCQSYTLGGERISRCE